MSEEGQTPDVTALRLHATGVTDAERQAVIAALSAVYAHAITAEEEPEGPARRWAAPQLRSTPRGGPGAWRSR